MEMGKTLAVVEFVTFTGTAPQEPVIPSEPETEESTETVDVAPADPQLAPVG